MTTGHVTDHNDLRTRLLSEASRHYTSVDIGGAHTIGDAAHVNEHTQLCIGLIKLAAVEVDTFSLADPGLTLPDVANVGDTGHITDHALIEAALVIIEGVTLPW